MIAFFFWFTIAYYSMLGLRYVFEVYLLGLDREAVLKCINKDGLLYATPFPERGRR